MRWEYKTLKIKNTWGTINTETFEAELNAVGRDGWELVNLTQDAGGFFWAVFKRSK